MTTIPPSIAHELEAADDYNPDATGTTDDLRSESEEEYPCEECERSFDTPQGLASHSRSHG